jgi:hypothetical protein
MVFPSTSLLTQLDDDIKICNFTIPGDMCLLCAAAASFTAFLASSPMLGLPADWGK